MDPHTPIGFTRQVVLQLCAGLRAGHPSQRLDVAKERQHLEAQKMLCVDSHHTRLHFQALTDLILQLGACSTKKKGP